MHTAFCYDGRDVFCGRDIKRRIICLHSPGLCRVFHFRISHFAAFFDGYSRTVAARQVNGAYGRSHIKGYAEMFGDNREAESADFVGRTLTATLSQPVITALILPCFISSAAMLSQISVVSMPGRISSYAVSEAPGNAAVFHQHRLLKKCRALGPG